MKNKKILVLFFTIAMVFLSTSIAFASGIGGNGNTIRLGSTQMKFTPAYEQRMGYGYNGYIFVKNYHQGQYGIYSPVKSGNQTPYATMKSYVKENSVNELGNGGEHLVNSSDWNLKKGSSDPTKWGPEAYNGDNTGTFYLSDLTPPKYYEHRYLGYMLDGTVVSNPFFPADNSGGVRPDLKNWYTFSKMKTSYPSLHHTPTHLNDKPDKAKQTFETWFRSTEIGALFKQKALENGATPGEEWKYWNERLAIQSDIDEGAGILKGWHYNNGMWYQTFPVPKPPKNNITLTKFELIDPDTGEVIVAHTRELDPNDVMNVSKENLYYTNYDAVIEKGKTYKLRAEYWYNSIPDKPGDLPEPTKTGSIVLDRHIAYDATVSKYNTFNEEYMMKDGKGLISYDKPVVLQPGEKAHFEWDYEVPDTVQSKGSIYVKVPPTYTEKGDDYVREDNWLNVTFKVAQNDIGFTQPVELYNSTGKKVNFVYPNEAHTVKFNVKHFLGKTPIGLDPIKNPKTTIDVVITDGNNNVIRSATLRSDEILNPNSQISMEVKNIATPTTMIKACATINKIHKEKGLNSNPQNDTICQIFAQAKNYAIRVEI